MMERHLEFTGCLLLALALVHAAFPRKFRWGEELAKVGQLTRQIFYVHTFFIALTVGLMGLLCLTSSTEMVETALGRKVSLGLAIFWTCRLLIQFFGYSSDLWKGKRFETVVHCVFAVLWLYFSVVFFVVAFAP